VVPAPNFTPLVVRIAILVGVALSLLNLYDEPSSNVIVMMLVISSCIIEEITFEGSD
jgi:hypothetical protein